MRKFQTKFRSQEAEIQRGTLKIKDTLALKVVADPEKKKCMNFVLWNLHAHINNN